jgi:uncharacterized protein RhaS with RHS repeats
MLSYSYDALNRQITETIKYIAGGNKTLSVVYDRYGNQSSLILDDGITHTSTYQYNKRNQLTQAVLPSNQTFTADYYQNNDLKTLAYPSGLTRHLQYAPNGPVSSIEIKKADNSALEQYQYTFDKVLNIKTLSDNEGQRNYSYDGLDHLTSATYPQSSALTDEGYTYDKVGNRQVGNSQSYSYDANHRLTDKAAENYNYDNAGNLTSKSDGTNYTYDHQNRLSQYQQGDIIATYAYNAQNQRIKKEVADTSASTTTTTWYLYAGANLIAEYDQGGIRQKRYDYLPGNYSPSQMQDQNGTFTIHEDHLDTPRRVTDQNDNVVWLSDHQAFGEANLNQDPDNNGSEVILNQRFPGQYYDQ